MYSNKVSFKFFMFSENFLELRLNGIEELIYINEMSHRSVRAVKPQFRCDDWSVVQNFPKEM